MRSPSKGWSKASRSLSSRGARARFAAKCGARCFLDPKNLKYPVCAPRSRRNPCRYDCRGLLSAYSRARALGNRAVASRARYLAVSSRCSWTL